MSMAKKADRHALYEHSVQSPDEEIKFITKQFKKLRGRVPLSLRKDFCGTAHFAARQTPLMQSPATAQLCCGPHGGHRTPPQSISVSVPFFR